MEPIAPHTAPAVFISHAEEDRASALTICEHLEARGITCWLASRNVGLGADYADAIIRGIDGATAVVLVLSESANASVFVRKEIERAVSKGKAVLPVRVRDVQPTGALELFVSSAQWIDAWKPPIEQHLDRLAVALRALIAGTAFVPIPPALATSRGWKSRALLAGALAVALATTLLWGSGTLRFRSTPATPELTAEGFLAAIDADHIDDAIDRWMSARTAALSPRPQLVFGLSQMRTFQGSPVSNRSVIARL